MKLTCLKCEIHDSGLCEVSLNRPNVHNAFDDQLIKELTELLEKLQNEKRVRLLVLKGEGKSFSAGADLNWMRAMADFSWKQNYQDSLGLATLMSTLANFTRPTVALVHGSAFGGGVGLVACCDFAIAAESTKFSLSETKLGLVPAVISPYVVRAIGKRQAFRTFYSAEVFDAKEARRIGLVQVTYKDDDFKKESHAFIDKILNNGPEAIYQSKHLIEYVADKPLTEEVIRDTAQKIADIRATAEGKEGVSAFLEKRKPNWDDAKPTSPDLLA